MTGKMPAAVYARLAAVAASIFSSMAVRERGANGRARRAVLEEVELADFAANGLRPPRYFSGPACVTSYIAEHGSTFVSIVTCTCSTLISGGGCSV